jgi:hypothetical protein
MTETVTDAIEATPESVGMSTARLGRVSRLV